MVLHLDDVCSASGCLGQLRNRFKDTDSNLVLICLKKFNHNN